MGDKRNHTLRKFIGTCSRYHCDVFSNHCEKNDYSAVPSIAPDNKIIMSSYSNKYMYLEERRSPLHTCDSCVKAGKSVIVPSLP